VNIRKKQQEKGKYNYTKKQKDEKHTPKITLHFPPCIPEGYCLVSCCTEHNTNDSYLA
jgi:hypothetical protein